MKDKQLLYRGTTKTHPVPLSKTQAQTLTAFRRSPYAKAIQTLLEDVLAITREENETNPATEERRLRVAAAKEVLHVVFTGDITLAP